MILFYKGEVYEWINEHWARSKKITEQKIKIVNGNFPLDSRDFLGKEDVNVNMYKLAFTNKKLTHLYKCVSINLNGAGVVVIYNSFPITKEYI